MIKESSVHEDDFFIKTEKVWTDIRVGLGLLIFLRDQGVLDSEGYIDLCRHLKLSLKSDDHLWKGVVSHFPECDRLNYKDVLKLMQIKSGLEYVNLANFKPSKELEVLPKKLISYCELLIFSINKSEVSVAMLNPFNEKVRQLLDDYFTLPVKFYLTDIQSFNTFVKGRESWR